MRKTKIVATIGPASESKDTVAELVRAGVDVFRLNYSHGTQESQGRHVETIRAAAAELGREVGILQDLAGPKIRTGDVAGGGEIPLEVGQLVTLVREPGEVRPGVLTTTVPGLADELKPDERVLLSDGRLELVVAGKSSEGTELRVVRGGSLRSRSGINLPTTDLSTPSMTDKDRSDLAHGLDSGANITALSFVRRATDLDAPRAEAASRGRELFLVAKIEKPEAIDHLDEILEKSDGVMVARGDLGVEVPAEQVPLLQKRIIREANRRRTPVITATQMLESMVNSPVPTRAEASDVANAIFDGTDAVMLSGETAVGGYPVEAVRTMARIAEKADELEPDQPARRRGEGEISLTRAVTRAASQAATDVGAQAIVVYTESGTTARLLSATRPRVPILALSPNVEVVRQLRLSWGVFPRLMPQVSRLAEMLDAGEQILIDAGQVELGDRVVVVSGTQAASPGGTNMLKILTVGELAAGSGD